MSDDILTRLARIAPDEADLERRWPAGERDALARRVLAGEVGDGALLRHRAPRAWRRPVVAGSLVAAAGISAFAVPAVLPQGAPGAASPAAADALHHLAAVAARTPADSLRPGQLVHTVTTSRQVGVPENPELGPVVDEQRRESWTAYDGRSWTRVGEGTGSEVLYAGPDRESGASYAASLPTDPDALGRYLREHAHGSSSHDEAVFLAGGDLMGDDTAPAGVRSAAAAALAQVDHVRLGPTTTDTLGRRVVELDFVDQSIRPGQVQSFLVDPATAQVLGRRTTQPGSSFAATLVSSSVVDAVPPAVLRVACPVSGPIC